MKTKNLLYAGIGSRKTPVEVLALMEKIAFRLAKRGWTLRSGGADGADSAFEQGCDGNIELWLPWKGFNRRTGSYCLPESHHHEAASLAHPYWSGLRDSVRNLHARNMGQISGADLKTHVEFVACWTDDGCENEASSSVKTGGTRTAIVAADRLGLPVINLKNEGSLERIRILVEKSENDGKLP